ncbi:MAG: formate dehydrogenase accessory sulfurtransferase FdhD [Burkholderiaceae bacterium]
MQMRELPVPPVCGSSTAVVRGLRDGKAFEREDWVAQEVPLALEYNGIAHAVMLATPADLEDFAVGFSRSEGIVDEVSQIYDFEAVEAAKGYTLSLQIAASCMGRLKQQRRTLAGRTGCGLCGVESLEHALRVPDPLPAGTQFSASTVSRALASLRERQPLLGVTGATHAAAWCDADGSLAYVREDVGRHNALDKLIGAMLRARMPAGDGFMLISSRASYEMVQKAATAGVTVLAAVSGVTALAIDVAQEAGLALLGFARGDDLCIYSHGERIVLTATPWTTTT